MAETTEETQARLLREANMEIGRLTVIIESMRSEIERLLQKCSGIQ